jgi:hypothetical protein
MKATVDVPDRLYRRVKARAALEGRSIRDVTIELYESWLAREPGAEAAPADAADAAARWLARWDNLGKRIAEKGVDPRTTREILLADRR